MVVERIYTLAEIEEVYARHDKFPSSVLYSEDNGESWHSVPKERNTWKIWNWIFAFVQLTRV